MIELAPHYKVECLRSFERFFRLDSSRRPNEPDLHFRVDVLHHFRDFDVHMETRTGCKELQQFEIAGHGDGLVDTDLVGWGVYDLAVFEHSGRIAKPHGVPIRFNLARRGPSGAGAAVKAFKRRWIQK